MLNIQLKKPSGFTLLELMIAVAIIGILATVAGSAFYAQILKSKSAEGLVLIRTYYDAEIVFASKNAVTVRDSTYGDVSCKPVPTFMSICSKGTTGPNNSIVDYPPTRKRQYALYFKDKNYVVYNPSNNTCTFDDYVGHPDYLGFTTGTSIRQNGTEAYYLMPTPSYFLVRARKDTLLATQYSVPINDTLMITAAADLDGDFKDGRLYCRNYGLSPSQAYFSVPKISIYARGIYKNSEGELVGTEIITHKDLE